jgi:hypothetical protein
LICELASAIDTQMATWECDQQSTTASILLAWGGSGGGMMTRIGMALVASVLFIAHPALAHEQPIAPQVLFEDLYADVELQRIFPDSKEFADATPKSPPPDILTLYHAQKPLTPEALTD